MMQNINMLNFNNIFLIFQEKKKLLFIFQQMKINWFVLKIKNRYFLRILHPAPIFH